MSGIQQHPHHRLVWQALLIGLTLLWPAAPSQAQSITACDWEAAHPSDPDRVGPGRGSAEFDIERALSACQLAVDHHPDEARFQYQLGRALVYQADRDGSDWTVGLPALVKAAQLGHRQGQFVLGLMRLRQDQPCPAATLYAQAAEQGLKSARISYVNAYLAGNWSGCDTKISHQQMQAWLSAARSQVSGYYENMLLDSLQRQLEAHRTTPGTSG